MPLHYEVRQLCWRLGNLAESCHEFSIIGSQPKKRPHIMLDFRLGPLHHKFQLLQRGVYSRCTDFESEITNTVFLKMSHRWSLPYSLASWSLCNARCRCSQCSSIIRLKIKMPSKYTNKKDSFLLKKIIHKPLECSWCIVKSRRHDKEFPLPHVGGEGSPMYWALVNGYLMISGGQTQPDKDPSLSKFI